MDIIFDFDDTLAATHSLYPGREPQGGAGVFELTDGEQSRTFQCLPRPHLREVLERLSKRHTLHLYTSGTQVYVESATAALGIRERFTKVLHRADCIKGEPVSDGFIETDLRKDLTRITDDLAHTVMVEDFPQTILQRENAMPIRMWIGDPDDEELLELERFIQQIENEPDVRALDLWNWWKR
jgi:TFIIF-interacting CTD phosphatase-like protein